MCLCRAYLLFVCVCMDANKFSHIYAQQHAHRVISGNMNIHVVMQ